MKSEKDFPVYPPLFVVRITEKLRQFFMRLNRRFTDPGVVMWEMVHNFWLAAGIGVVAELGIADLLKDGPLGIADLAKATATDEDSLYRVMRMLASQGIFKALRDRRFVSTPLAVPLREDRIRYLLLLHLNPQHFRMFGDLLTCVKTGKNVTGDTGGKALFRHIGSEGQRNERFNLAMSNASNMQVPTLLPAFSFRDYRKIIDIGGGQGLFLAALLRHSRESTGIVFDLPQAVSEAGEIISAHSLGDRMEAVEGDFFKTVPEGGDLYILKSVLHDWDDEHAQSILGNVHKAMDERSCLLVIDTVIGEDNSPSFGKMTDILMMVSAGGRERTRPEFEDLLRRSGFRISKIHRTISPHSLIEVYKI
jgi:hypothetical protein